MKKQKSYHWHFIIAISILAVIFSALILRENIFYGTGHYVEKAIKESGREVNEVLVSLSRYDSIRLEGNEIDRFIKALDYIKVRKMGKFDRVDALDGKAKYYWVLGSKSWDVTGSYPTLKITFNSSRGTVTTVRIRQSESLSIDNIGSFFLKTPVYADDIFAIAMACKN